MSIQPHQNIITRKTWGTHALKNPIYNPIYNIRKWHVYVERTHCYCFQNSSAKRNKKLPNESSTDDVEQEGDSLVCTGDPLTNTECGQHFSSKQELFDHQVENEHFYKYCCLCDFTFAEKRNLRRHIASIHQNVKHKCRLCKKMFPREDLMKKHQWRVHGIPLPMMDQE